MFIEGITNRRFSGIVLKGLARLGVYNTVREQFIRYSRLGSRRAFAKVREDLVLGPPSNIVFEPTYRCNLRCAMCYQERDPDMASSELSVEQIKNIFTSRIKGVRKVNLIGGEVFMRKDIFEIIAFFDSRKVPVHITTNGTLLDEDACARLSRLSNIQAIGVSVDGPKDLHDRMRGWQHAFERAARGVELARRCFFVFMVAVISDDNVGRLPEIVETAHGLGLGNLILEFERKYTRQDLREASEALGFPESDFRLRISGSKDAGYPLAALVEGVKAAEEKAKSIGMRIFYLPDDFISSIETHYSKCGRSKGRYFCRSIFKGRIDSKGNVFHCYAIRKIFGSVLEKPFLEIWNSPEYVGFRRRLMGRNLLSLCETCLYMERI